jgi:hypothetical protein
LPPFERRQGLDSVFVSTYLSINCTKNRFRPDHHRSRKLTYHALDLQATLLVEPVGVAGDEAVSQTTSCCIESREIRTRRGEKSGAAGRQPASMSKDAASVLKLGSCLVQETCARRGSP